MTHYRHHLAKDGPWYRVLVRVNGRQCKRSFPTRRLAELWLEQQYGRRLGLALPELAPAPSLREILDAYRLRCRELRRSPETLTHYESLAARLLDGLGGDRRAADLDQADVLAYVRWRRDQAGGEHRIVRELAHLRTACRAAGVAPVWTVPELRPVHHHRRVLADHEVAKLWRASADDAVTRRAVALALLTGMRPGEVLAAETSWLDLEARTIRVVVAKTGSENVTALVSTLTCELRDLTPGRLVPLTETALRHRLWRRSVAAGIEPALTGTARLRPTCATWAHEAGWTQEQIALLLAHRRPGVTGSYLHGEAVALKREMLEAVEARLLAALDTGT